LSTLTNQRHELLAQHLASGKSATEAYTLAGYKPNRRNASLLKQIKTFQDVAELQTRNLEIGDQKNAVSAKRLAAQLAKAYAIAAEAKRPVDMVAASGRP
jgi:phage terminase small subunit